MENNLIITAKTEVERLTIPKRFDYNWPTNNTFQPNINLDNKFYIPNSIDYTFQTKNKDE